MRDTRVLEILLFPLVLMVVSSGCDTQQNVSQTAMISLLQSLREAVEAKNPDKIAVLCQDSPMFFVRSNGESMGFDGFVSAQREIFRTMKHIRLNWDTLHVKIVSPDAVAALVLFKGVFTDTNGAENRLTGEATLIAKRIGNEWKLVYAHAAHRPEIDVR